MSEFLCPAVIQGCGIRLTDLDQWDIPIDPLVEESRVFTSGFIDLAVEPIVYQNAPIAIGGESEGEACIVDNDTPKLVKFKFTMRVCNVAPPLFAKLIGAILTPHPTIADLMRGLILKDGYRECCADTLMLEIFAKNADGCEEECIVSQWIFPLTRNWQLTGSFTYQNGETEFTFSGEGEANPNFFPSMPGPTLPSYDANGVPEGPAPAVLPLNLATNATYVADDLTQADVDGVREHGPVAMFCLPALPDGIDDCGFMNHSLTALLAPPVVQAQFFVTRAFGGPDTHDLLIGAVAGTSPINPDSLVMTNIDFGLGPADNRDGTFTIDGTQRVGVYRFDYSFADVNGLRSNTATAEVLIQSNL